MSTRRDRLIREALGEAGEKSDHSLHGKALERALGKQPPKTLTAWEWEAWYERNGVPAAHRAAPGSALKGTWWRRWWKRIKD